MQHPRDYYRVRHVPFRFLIATLLQLASVRHRSLLRQRRQFGQWTDTPDSNFRPINDHSLFITGKSKRIILLRLGDGVFSTSYTWLVCFLISSV
jgi:hypothetical protein